MDCKQLILLERIIRFALLKDLLDVPLVVFGETIKTNNLQENYSWFVREKEKFKTGKIFSELLLINGLMLLRGSTQREK